MPDSDSSFDSDADTQGCSDLDDMYKDVGPRCTLSTSGSAPASASFSLAATVVIPPEAGNSRPPFTRAKTDSTAADGDRPDSTLPSASAPF